MVRRHVPREPGVDGSIGHGDRIGAMPGQPPDGARTRQGSHREDGDEHDSQPASRPGPVVGTGRRGGLGQLIVGEHGYWIWKTGWPNVLGVFLNAGSEQVTPAAFSGVVLELNRSAAMKSVIRGSDALSTKSW